MKKKLAALATAALALGGCSGGESIDRSRSENPTSSLQMNLTLPDGTQINSVNYTVTGGPSSVTRNGSVNIQNSSILRFRVGNLPVGPGYTMALAGSTVGGTSCAGTAGFNIADNLVTTLTMSLTCGGGVTYEVDNNGDVSVSVDVVNQAGVTCPVVTGISALPSEVFVGATLSLEGFVSSTDGASLMWTGSGGTFSAASAAATDFTCGTAGDQTLTFAVSKTGCDTSSQPVVVTCTGTDAGTETDAGADSGTETDAGTDAGTDSGPPPDTCRQCLSAAGSACRDYQGSGFDLFGNCYENPDPMFVQRCVDAVQCSLQATDLCAGDLTRGPVSCYCGLDRTIDQCNAPTPGPNGACIPQWEAATGCAAGDNACVNNLFVDLTLPSGGASFLITCAVNDCASACALPRPAGTP